MEPGLLLRVQQQGPVDRFGELQILPGPGSWLTEPREPAGSLLESTGSIPHVIQNVIRSWLTEPREPAGVLPESTGSVPHVIQKSDQTGWPEPGSWLSDFPLEPWVRVQWAEQAG